MTKRIMKEHPFRENCWQLLCANPGVKEWNSKDGEWTLPAHGLGTCLPTITSLEAAWQPCVTNMASFNFINGSKINHTRTCSVSVLQAQCKGEKPGKAEDFHRLWTGGREKGDKGRQKGGKEEKKEARKRTYFMKTFFIHSWNTCNRQ